MQKKFTEKLWTLMKICIGQVVIFLIVCSVCLAHENYAQLLERRVTLSLSSAPFESALKEIESAAQVRFVYSMNQLREEERVSIQVEHEKLSVVLEDLFGPRQISFKVHERESTITLKKLKGFVGGRSSAEADDAPMLLEITGRVSDAVTQLPMAGVNILVKGTTIGTTTNAEGQFAIEANSGDVLVFSFIGFATQEHQVGDALFIQVALVEDMISLKDVVINAGYWSVADRERTGNIVRVDAEQIGKQPVSNPLLALQGRAPGVYITQMTGVPGGGVRVQIRGRNSLVKGNDPLYIVDGVPFTSQSLISRSFGASLVTGSPLSTINPVDIESIEILKDADATSIYGSRAANGVVLITTKKGKAGRTKFDLSFETGYGEVPHFMDLLNTQQYLEMREEAFENDGIAPTISTAYDLLAWDTTRYTDWQEKLLGGKAKTLSLQGSVSGGNEKTQFLFSGGFYKEGTVFPGDLSYQRGNGSLNLSHSEFDGRLKASVAVSYQSEGNDVIANDLTSNALRTAPNAPAVFDSNGKLNWGPTTFSNPYSALFNNYEVKTNNLIGNTVLGFSLTDALRASMHLGYTQMRTQSYYAATMASQNPASVFPSRSYWGTAEIKTWIVEPQIDFTKDVGRGKIHALAGMTLQENENFSQSLQGAGYANDFLLRNLRAATTITVQNSEDVIYRYSGAFAHINYIHNEKYIVNLNARRDGSSRFGGGNRFANFGSAGLGWIFSKEDFLTSLSFLSFGKLRTSYGTSGNDQIGDYGFMDTYSTGQYAYQGSIALVPTRLANRDFSWETNKKFEVGAELSFLNDKVNMSISYYNNRSSNQLVGIPLPAMTGFTSVQANLDAIVENDGWEVMLQTSNLSGQDFEWQSSFNITIPKNRLISFPGLSGSPYSSIFEIGKPLNLAKVYSYTSVDPETGIYQFADLDENGTISSPQDRIVVDRLGQEFYGGVHNSLRYKNFELEFFFQFVKQEGKNFLNSAFARPGVVAQNQPVEVLDRWQQPGDEAAYQRFSAGSGPVAVVFSDLTRSDRTIGDASFIRLKNVSVGYAFSSNLIGKAGLTRAYLFVRGQNLLTITKYAGFDPEYQNFISLPPLRTLTAGFQLTF